VHAFLQSDGSRTPDERAAEDFVLGLRGFRCGPGWAHVARIECLEVLDERGRPLPLLMIVLSLRCNHRSPLMCTVPSVGWK